MNASYIFFPFCNKFRQRFCFEGSVLLCSFFFPNCSSSGFAAWPFDSTTCVIFRLSFSECQTLEDHEQQMLPWN